MSDEVIAEESVPGADVPVTDESAAVELDIEALLAERDEYKDIALRLQADFENYKKRVAQQSIDDIDRATGSSQRRCCRFSMPARRHSPTGLTVSNRSGPR